MPYPDGNNEYLGALAAASGLAKSLFGDPEMKMKADLAKTHGAYYSAAAEKARAEAQGQVNQNTAQASLAQLFGARPDWANDPVLRQQAVSLFALANPAYADKIGSVVRSGYAASANPDQGTLANLVVGAGGDWGHTMPGGVFKITTEDATKRYGADAAAAAQRYTADRHFAGQKYATDNAQIHAAPDSTVVVSPNHAAYGQTSNGYVNGPAKVVAGQYVQFPSAPGQPQAPGIYMPPRETARAAAAGKPLDPRQSLYLDAELDRAVGVARDNAGNVTAGADNIPEDLRVAVKARAGEYVRNGYSPPEAIQAALGDLTTRANTSHWFGKDTPTFSPSGAPLSEIAPVGAAAQRAETASRPMLLVPSGPPGLFAQPQGQSQSPSPAPAAASAGGGGKTPQQIIDEANDAIRRGADPAKVRERLRAMGIDLGA